MEFEIVARLEEAIKFLKPFLPLVNCHMVNFISQNLWENHIPIEIRNEVASVSVNDLNKIFVHYTKDSLTDQMLEDDFKNSKERFPFFNDFLSKSRNMSLKGISSEKIITERSDMQKKLTAFGWKGPEKVFFEQFMTQKKMHEVEVMSEMVAALVDVSQASHVIDVGGGKGYLSSFLSLYHGIKILGVDSSQINTHGAAKRSKNLERIWTGLCRRAEMLKEGHIPPRRGKHWKSQTSVNCSGKDKMTNDCSDKSNLYKLVTEYVTPHSDLSGLVNQHFENDTCQHLCITGLHTCGNLASSCLKIFTDKEEFHSLCNIGCCYHLMEEKYCQNPFWNDIDPPLAEEIEYGFPLSKFLNERQFSLGRNARMLAAQALDRMGENHQVQSESLFFRALLQVILLKKCGDILPWGQVGRLASKCQNFVEYVEKAFKKLNIEIEVRADEIESFYKEYVAEQEKLHAFFLLRVSLAPVIEAIILLDRLLYLHEQGFHNSYLIKLFDPVISPRCYCILSLKNKS